MQHLNRINHQGLPALSGLTLPVIDPATGETYAHLARSDARDVDLAVQGARACFEGPWARLDATDRGRLLMALSRRVGECADELAAIEQRDCGKPTQQARADVVALARYFEFYAGACDKLHGDTLPFRHGYTALTWREPHGVTGHVIPWNYPLQIFGRSIGGALAAGNVCVVKPAEDACLSLLRVSELMAEVGFPAGSIQMVTGLGHEAGQALCEHPGIDHISFTGSPRVGTLVQQLAATHHCPVTLELGGKSPQILFDDAPVDLALGVLINAIVQNAGQTCSAGSRLLVQRSLYEPLLHRLGEAFGRLRAGPPELDLDLGPLIRASQLDRVVSLLDEAQRDGIATVARGVVVPEASPAGFFHPPVLLRDVPVQHRIAQEEVFGPVLCAMPFDDEEDALALAHATPFGLVAGVWTRDGARQMRMARALRCGQVFINNYGAGGGIELPFGGVGASGHGREKGFEALMGFTRLKTVAMRHDGV